MTASSGDLPESVIDLQIRVAYQDHLVAQLDEVVRQLADRVVALERDLAELRLRLDDTAEVGPHDEKPPHY